MAPRNQQQQQSDEEKAAAKAEAERLAAEQAAAINAAAEKAGAEGQKVPSQDTPAPTAPVVIVHAKRAMWRAGRPWNAGANELTREQLAALTTDQRLALEGDPNFTLAAAGDGSVVVLEEGQPIDAHLVVMAKRAMWRAGRSWNAGANALDEAQALSLTAEQRQALRDDANFTLIDRQAA